MMRKIKVQKTIIFSTKQSKLGGAGEERAVLMRRRKAVSNRFLQRVHTLVLNVFNAQEYDFLQETLNDFSITIKQKYFAKYGEGLLEHALVYVKHARKLQFLKNNADNVLLAKLACKNNLKILGTFLSSLLCGEDRKNFDENTRLARIEKLHILFALDKEGDIRNAIYGEKIYPHLSKLLGQDIEKAFGDTIKSKTQSSLLRNISDENTSPNIQRNSLIVK